MADQGDQYSDWRGATFNNVQGNQTNVTNIYNPLPSAQSWQEKVVNAFSTKQQAEAKEQLNLARRNAHALLEAALSSTNEVASGGQSGDQLLAFQDELKSLQKIVDMIDVEVLQRLAAGFENMNVALTRARRSSTYSDSMLHRISHLSLVWGTPVNKLLETMSSGIATRLFWSYEDRADGYLQSILWSMHNFTVEASLAVEFALDEDGREARAENETPKLSNELFNVQELKLNMDPEGFLTPPYARSARWDYNNEQNIRMPCLQGTRVEILSQVETWMKSGGPEKVSALTQGRSIFWINGSAGTGKTTIAFTVAESCHLLGLLGASFFSSHDDVSSSNPSLIFTTIAYQLGCFHRPFKAKVSAALQADPDVIYSGIPHQLKRLIVDPLNEVKDTFPRCVVVLDALDECRDSNSTSIILSSLARYIQELSPIKFLITSRPVLHVVGGFQLTGIHKTTHSCVLHELPLDVVANDIQQVLSAGLDRIRHAYQVEEEWPVADDLHALKDLASGLFIFAATALKFIEDKNYSDPKKQLVLLLKSNVTVGSSPQQQLDRLYGAVLAHAFPDLSAQLMGRLRLVLGSIALLSTPVSPLVLDDLLDLKSGSVRQTLQHLHSVVIVPERDDQVIRVLHPSFSDFLVSPQRCSDQRFLVTPPMQHTMLAISCLHTMTQLRRDICQIEDPSRLNTDISNLSERIGQRIPAHLQYACCHWARHLCSGLVSDRVLGALLDFCSMHMLYWVEVCSMLGELQNAIFALNAVQKFLYTIKMEEDQTSRLLHDCERFIQEFFPVLGMAASQVYYTALPFTPRNTALYDTYSGELKKSVQVYRGSDGWYSCLRTMEGHTGWVQSVDFSPSGTQIISGSHDQTLKVWDAVSGTCLNTFTEQTSSVLSVAFCPDGTLVASGSNSGTIFIWNAFTGDCVKMLEGHSAGVQSVAFSPDGTKIVSGSYDTTMKLWDVMSGSCLQTFQQHLDSIYSVTFSTDGSYLLSGSQDTAICLYDMDTYSFIKSFKSHRDSIYSVAFCPDKAHIISGSADQTVQIHNMATGKRIHVLKGHTGGVYCVTYSHDGTLIASGSADKTIRLWNASTCETLNVFQGHSNWVYSLKFSIDDAQIVSGSDDMTVRLWDTVTKASPKQKDTSSKILALAFSPNGSQLVSGLHSLVQLWDTHTGTLLKTFKGHNGGVSSVGFSTDGLWVISGSHDATVKTWDLANGVLLQTLKGHSLGVQTIAYAPNAPFIASGSADRRILLWNASTGNCLSSYIRHTEDVQVVVFSYSGTHLASGSRDKTIILWDVATGGCNHVLTGHWGWVQSVAFSPDDTLIASGSYDRTVRLWSSTTGATLCWFKTDHVDIPWLMFSPGQRHIITPKEVLVVPEEVRPEDGLQKPLNGYILQNEWLYSLKTKKRACWLPVAYRGLLIFRDDCVVLGTTDGTVVFLNFGSFLTTLVPLVFNV